MSDKTNSTAAPQSGAASRRSFVRDVAKKAAYVAPVVLALTSRDAVAGVSGCGQDGSVCVADTDCCTGWTCQDMGIPVMSMMSGTCMP